MYDIIKNVINSGRFELSDILKKIDTIWIQGDISETQKTELVSLAREKANPSDSYAPLQNQIDKAFEAINELKNRVSKLENAGQVDPQPQPEEYPEYKQPTGAHDAYHKDDKMTFKSEKYICIAPEGVAVVWNPEEYPAYWKKVEPVVEPI